MLAWCDHAVKRIIRNCTLTRTQRYRATEPDDEVGLTAAIIGYATKYGRYGYRRILAFGHSRGTSR